MSSHGSTITQLTGRIVKTTFQYFANFLVLFSALISNEGLSLVPHGPGEPNPNIMPKIGITSIKSPDVSETIEDHGGLPVSLLDDDHFERMFSKSFLSKVGGKLTLRRFAKNNGFTDWYAEELDEAWGVIDNLIKENREKNGRIHFKELLDQMINWNEVYYAVQSVDGIILPGGPDITPLLYSDDETLVDKLQDVHRTRDILELAYLFAALDLKKPVFGICHGMQLLGVFYGAKLVPDIPEDHEHLEGIHRSTLGEKFGTVHEVFVDTTTKFKEILGITRKNRPSENREEKTPLQRDHEEPIEVTSYHHQSLRNIDPGKLIVGLVHRSFHNNRVVEIVEGIMARAKGNLVFGMQGHDEKPKIHQFESNTEVDLFEERSDHSKNLFDAFFECVRKTEECKKFAY